MTENNTIVISEYTKTLIDLLDNIKKRSPPPDELSTISVSQTVSFLALVYEKIRNAVEFREDHLILRAAIERILKRRLSINPQGKGEGENLIRELLWARYFDNNVFGVDDVNKIQLIIDRFIYIKEKIIYGRQPSEQECLFQFLMDIITSEIEEYLNSYSAQIKANQSYYIFQVLKGKIKIEELNEEKKDAYFLAAIEKVFRRSDRAYLRYHLFTIFYQRILDYSDNDFKKIVPKLPLIFKNIDEISNNSYVDKLVKFIKKQLPPFLVLFTLIKKNKENKISILTDKEKLYQTVDEICREKYQQMQVRTKNLAIRSFIYILLTKMIFALILEFPLSQYFYNEVNYQSILINTIFPAILMILIVSFFRVPDEKNTKRIYERIIDIINIDENFEKKISFIPKKTQVKKPILIFGFTVFYSLTFIITLTLIYELLTKLGFNLISQLIFIFFVSIVTFFSYRIKQITKEITLEEKESVLTPVVDFFFMPILSLGKFFSLEIAKLNFFIFIFDFIIEAPFKFIFEVVEEWISFVKKRKEEIV